MANPMKGEATFVHDGQQLTLAIDAGVLLEVEDETGIGLFQLIGTGLGRLGVLASILRHGVLQGSGISWTRKEAADVLLSGDAGDAVRLALTRALPKADEPESEGAETRPRAAARKRGTGTKS